ncbi:zinc transporter ZIP10-like [Stegodyphus dumicola]|uniref:zinc transporter ZIP10-like n=1 Tax=Stegodyphus dumicola TaxID=202533 RepID=UPI0015AC3D5B|nr:zinc transporter ZIP10-like [Stegodyphus dumicola]XP_035218172.1 zinc transporter ZIP10-like [Stegodyphus dumicola]XP_035218173.1 zinc transporter ZIP10-like [Stegodyphus dumicola]XP_035218174.1 zinc transporter ZIP10-like [Stegodyphus dumicola]
MASQVHYYVHLCVFCAMMMCSRCHSTVAQKPDDLHPSGEPHVPHVSDHRFFLQEIFTKYGHDGQMTFEGFEHLLESLGLGNIIINDHDVKAHKEEAFRNAHDTHEHAKKVDVFDFTKKKESEEKVSSHSHRHPSDLHDDQGRYHTSQQMASSTTRKSVSSNESRYRHSSRNALPPAQGSEKLTTAQTDYRPMETPENRTQDHSLHSSDSIYHYHLKEANIPELLMNITHLVDQHQELKDESPEVFIQQCLSPKEILETFGIDYKSSLNPVSFLHLCPAIIYELDQRHCMFQDYSHKKVINIVTVDQWLYSSVAVVAISLCGLFSVAVIPIMQKWFYQTLLQFLVGLAIGSLSGDALLHLMPHAMLGGEGSHDHDIASSLEVAEKTAVWRGFTALGGILFFFVAEKLLASLTVYRKQKKDASSTKAVSPVQSALLEGSVGQKLSQYRKNSYDYQNKDEMIKMMQVDSCAQSHTGQDMTYSASSCHRDPLDSFDVEILQPRGHGHSHDVPHTVTAVAWMVIMGDGLHNFCDGLAIGAAFASGVEGGISTTVAVFCHELPHELGDFAMLLKTGMKVRQALLYNILSSILCFIGMVIGVSLGNVHSATSWVFAGTAGMFLYIALVDMLPELSSSSSNSGSTVQQLAVQVLGICTGVSIMLLIANYEQDLQTLVS